VRELVSAQRGPWCDPGDGLPSMSFEPRAPARVPMLIGGPSRRALRRAVEVGDGYIGVGTTADGIAESLSSIRGLAEAHGRDVTAFPVHFASATPPSLDDLLAYDRAGLDVLHVVPWNDPLAAASSPQQKQDALAAFAGTLENYGERCQRPARPLTQ